MSDINGDLCDRMIEARDGLQREVWRLVRVLGEVRESVSLQANNANDTDRAHALAVDIPSFIDRAIERYEPKPSHPCGDDDIPL